MTIQSNIPSADDVRDELLDLETNQDRLAYLIELGDLLSEFPKESCTEENRVLGCQSMVWLVPESTKDRIHFIASSDAPMVRGLIAILTAVYSGKSPQAILDFPINDYFDDIKLKSFLSPMRSNGLHSMIQRVRQIAFEALGEATPSESRSASRRVASKTQSISRSLETIRADFPILERKFEGGHQLVYLDNAASSQRPTSVLDSMDYVYRHHYSNAHRSGHEMAAETTSAMEAARESIRDFVNASETCEIIFTSGTTAAINIVARAWGDANVGPGDEILISEMEHHSNIVPWQQLATRVGAKVRWLPIRDDFHLDLDQLPKLICDRTKLVAITAVSNVLGTINPIRSIADAAHRVGSLILVDAAQAVPHGSIDVLSMDADFVAFGGHKMLGPAGTGVLYGKRKLLEAMPPFHGGGGMIQTVTHDGFTPAGLPHRFEAGTPASVEAIAMKSAIEYLQSIGADVILAHERRLVARAEEMLKDLLGLHIYGPPSSERTGILTFTIDGLHGDEIGRLLDAEGIAIRVGHHCAMPLHARLGIPVSCRASFYFYNTLEEAEQFAEAIHSIKNRLLGGPR